MSAWILTVALVGPPPESMKIVANDVDSVRSRDELREVYRGALQKAAKRRNPKPEQVVPDLVAVYTELGNVKGIAHSETSRMRGVVKARLEQLRDRLAREKFRHKKRLARARRTRRDSDKLAGGGEIARANELIDLIETTISPESWDVNGGNCTIRYFPLLKVLVVRATSETHHQLGGALGQLRR